MYAYVKFVDDNIKYIVDTSDIKHFDINNINYTKKYKVKYKDGVYYKACILLTGNTPEEISKALDESRVKCPPTFMLLSSCDEEEHTNIKTDKNNQKSKKSTIAQSATIVKKNYDSLLKSIKLTTASTETENEDHNIDYYKSKLATLQKDNLQLKEVNLKLTEEVNNLRSLNYELQENLLNDWKELSKVLFNKVETHHKDQEKESTTISVGTRIDNKIHLGRNVYLDEIIYDSICFKSKNNSVFVKNLASALFGDYTLQNSSVTGLMCNRLKTDPRPPLNPTITMAIKDILQFKLTRENWTAEEAEAECKHINHILAQKIADVRRTNRTKKNIKDLDINEPTAETDAAAIQLPSEIAEIGFLSTEIQLSENLLQEDHKAVN